MKKLKTVFGKKLMHIDDCGVIYNFRILVRIRSIWQLHILTTQLSSNYQQQCSRYEGAFAFVTVDSLQFTFFVWLGNLFRIILLLGFEFFFGLLPE